MRKKSNRKKPRNTEDKFPLLGAYVCDFLEFTFLYAKRAKESSSLYILATAILSVQPF